MKKYVEPTLEVIKFAMNEEITTTDSEMWNPSFSPGVEDWG